MEGATPVLMYHSVSKVGGGPLRSLAVPPALLREQLVALTSSGYRLVGLTEAIDLRATGTPTHLVALTFDDGYVDFLTEGLSVLADVDASATLYMAVGHAGEPASWLGSRAAAFGPVMTWSQLREVASTGVEIGNHSLIHHPLDVLSPAQLDREIADSRDRLTQEIQRPVRSFAYPHGYHSAEVRIAVARAGHDNACAIGRRLYRRADDPLAVPRLQPTPDQSGADLLNLVRTGGPTLLPRLRELAQPGWRITRRVAQRRFGVRLT
jgi:peptidoglycan/xylan/chitin deacetylase (PgdA/CDA1 family)